MASLSTFDVDGCCCGGGTCNFTACVTGMSGTALAGATITVLASCPGGATIATGTTDGTGCVTVNIGSAGTYCVQVDATGFNQWTKTSSMSCAGSMTVPLASSNGGGGSGGGPATGYHETGCNTPASSLVVSIPAMFYTGSASWNSTWSGWQTDCIGPYPDLTYHVMIYFPAGRLLGGVTYYFLYWTFYWAFQCPGSPVSGSYAIGSVTCNPLHAFAAEAEGTVYFDGS